MTLISPPAYLTKELNGSTKVIFYDKAQASNADIGTTEINYDVTMQYYAHTMSGKFDVKISCEIQASIVVNPLASQFEYDLVSPTALSIPMSQFQIDPAECYEFTGLQSTKPNFVTVDTQSIKLTSNDRSQVGTYNVNVKAMASDGIAHLSQDLSLNLIDTCTQAKVV